MVVGLVPPEEEERICRKLMEYYQTLYPGIQFRMEEELLDKKALGGLYYTFPGEETEATAADMMKMISSEVGRGYSTPIIILKKKKKAILLDGHRRARVAYAQGMAWKAYSIVPKKDVKFGIEEMVLGRIKDLYKR